MIPTFQSFCTNLCPCPSLQDLRKHRERELMKIDRIGTTEQLTTALGVQIPMQVKGTQPAIPYTCLYSVHPYWWKRQVSHQTWKQERAQVRDPLWMRKDTRSPKQEQSVAPQSGPWSNKKFKNEKRIGIWKNLMIALCVLYLISQFKP